MKLDLNGYTELPPGKIAAVVTYLEITEPPAGVVRTDAGGLSLEPMDRADPAGYRDLFRRVGGRWLWFSRLQRSDDELAALLGDPLRDFFVLRREATPCGMLELDRGSPPDVEIVFFGLVEEVIGTGAGSFLMDRALELAWAHGPRRVWLHTCTLDHPRALDFYRRFNFRAYKRAIEVADDPRLSGIVPKCSAPQVPVIG